MLVYLTNFFNGNYMFTNKVVLVTGGSRGIGAAICKMFAKHNAKVYINYYSSEESAMKLKQEIEAAQGQAICVYGNVADANDVEAILKKITANDGKLDILINNAGIKVDSLMATMKNSDWDNVVQTNLSGAFYCSKAAVKLMLLNDAGVIINIASISGIIGKYGQANYSSAKAGLIALTKTMAKELARFNIRVNAIAPGFIETEMVNKMEPSILKNMVSTIPMGRVGTVEEVSHVVKFMVSNDASYINGECIVVDGGFSC
jgi:3-oxoacyl-[acyl-carrier protein] reductase